MKCVKKIGEAKIFRTTNKKAHELVDSGKYEFISKSIWKWAGRKYK